jgi:hypothetical protein
MRTFRNLYENFNLHLTFHLRSADCQRTMDGTSTAERGAARSHIPHAPASATEATTGSIEHPGRSAHTLATRSCLQGQWHPRATSKDAAPPTSTMLPRSTMEPPAPLPPRNHTTHRWRRFPVAVGRGSYSPLPLVAVPTRHGRHGSHRTATFRAPLPSARGGWDGRGIGSAPSPAACCDGG